MVEARSHDPRVAADVTELSRASRSQPEGERPVSHAAAVPAARPLPEAVGSGREAAEVHVGTARARRPGTRGPAELHPTQIAKRMAPTGGIAAGMARTKARRGEGGCATRRARRTRGGWRVRRGRNRIIAGVSALTASALQSRHATDRRADQKDDARDEAAERHQHDGDPNHEVAEATQRTDELAQAALDR